jgi:predicted nucleic acid-binding protein
MMEILDASALIAFLRKEKGYLVIKDLLNDAIKNKYSVFLHQINYIEVVNRSLKLLGETETKNILAAFPQTLIGIANYMDDALASIATSIKSSYHLSMADAIGLAFAKKVDGRFWTADKALKPIADREKINLKLIR